MRRKCEICGMETEEIVFWICIVKDRKWDTRNQRIICNCQHQRQLRLKSTSYDRDLFMKSLLLNDIHHFEGAAGLSAYTFPTNRCATSCLNWLKYCRNKSTVSLFQGLQCYQRHFDWQVVHRVDLEGSQVRQGCWSSLMRERWVFWWLPAGSGKVSSLVYWDNRKWRGFRRWAFDRQGLWSQSFETDSLHGREQGIRQRCLACQQCDTLWPTLGLRVAWRICWPTEACFERKKSQIPDFSSIRLWHERRMVRLQQLATLNSIRATGIVLLCGTSASQPPNINRCS